MLLPLILLAVLLGIVISANSMKKKGTISDATYAMLISISSIVVTIAAVVALIVRIRG